MAILVLGEKLDCFGGLEKIALDKNGLAFCLGPVMPPWPDGSPNINLKKYEFTLNWLLVNFFPSHQQSGKK